MSDLFKVIRTVFPVILLILGCPAGTAEAVRLQILNGDEPINQARWMEEGAKIQGPLMEMRKAAFEQKWLECLKKAAPARQAEPDLKPWIVKQELECIQQAKGAKLSEVQAILTRAKESLSPKGPWISELGLAYRNTHTLLLDSPTKAVASAIRDRIVSEEGLFESLPADGRARFLELMGDAAQADSQWEQARLLYQQSLANSSRSEVATKLFAIEKKLNLSSGVTTPSASTVSFHGSHQKDFEKAQTQAQKGRHFEAAVETLKYLEKHPASALTTEASTLIAKSYRALSDESKKSKLLKKMAKAEPELVQNWAGDIAARGDYAKAAELGALGLKRTDSLNFLASQHIQTARRFHWAGEYARAIEHFNLVRQQAAGTTESIEATYYKAISELRSLDYNEAHRSFNEIIDQGGVAEAEPYLMGSLYWAYRAHEALKEPQKGRDQYHAQLVKDYPMSYYSLLIHAEKNGGVLTWPVSSNKSTPKGSFVFLPADQKGWGRLQSLLAAGWYDEAWAELRALPQPVSSEQKIVFARYLAAAMAYPQAIRLLNQAWDEDTKWRSPEMVRMAYPVEFEAEINKAAEENSLSPLLVKSLVRQESAFSVPALSRSNAIGLMQLIPPTAREVLGWMGLTKKYKVPEDVYQPMLNLRLGSRYLRHVVKQFNQNVPIALASYNAGPTRMRRWLNSREETKDLSQKETWEPMDDLWIDELPWGEPRFYVKAILRNAMVYQLLDGKDVKLERPVWKSLTTK